MKTRLLLVMVLVSFLSLGLGTSLAAPALPDDMKIVAPDSSLPPENVAFFGKSGQWTGFWRFPPMGSFTSSENLKVTFVAEELKESEASIILSVEGSIGGVKEGWGRYTAKIFKKKGRTLLSFPLPTGADSYAEAIFWVRGGVLEGERTGQTRFGNQFVTTFKLNPL